MLADTFGSKSAKRSVLQETVQLADGYARYRQLLITFMLMFLAYSSVPRLKRGFSNTLENEEFVSVTRQSVLNDINEDLHDQMSMTFVLPDLSVYEDGFVRFLKSELIDSTMLTSLQLSGIL